MLKLTFEIDFRLEKEDRNKTIHSVFTSRWTQFEGNYPYSFKDLFLRDYK